MNKIFKTSSDFYCNIRLLDAGHVYVMEKFLENIYLFVISFNVRIEKSEKSIEIYSHNEPDHFKYVSGMNSF